MNSIFTVIKKLLKSENRYSQDFYVYFDWEKAARIISKEKPYIAYAGLRNSQESKYLIYQGGIPVYPKKIIISNKYLPCLYLNSSNDGIPCFTKDADKHSNSWTNETLSILKTKIKEQDYDIRRKSIEESPNRSSTDY